MNLGQLFITGISGLTLTNNEKDILEKENIGGIIFFAHNYEEPAQLVELTNEIKSLNTKAPLFLSVDQEGGRVQRFKSGFTVFPPMYELAKKLKSPKAIYELHSIMGKELAACGINLNFSPCTDIWTNQKNTVIGDRAFGNTADEVEKYTSAAIRGLQSQNVLACAKHFPGHGMTFKDSHFDLPHVTSSLKELEEHEIIPFIKAAKSKVHFVMMAHLLVDSIDKEYPTSLSANAYQLLRKYLKYQDVIISDDMEMKAVADQYGYGEAAVKALSAGCDQLIYRSMESMLEGYQGITKAFEQGQLDQLEFKQKLDRVQRIKNDYIKNYQHIDVTTLPEQINRDVHKEYLETLLS